jgi:hypothetical protein
MKFKGDIIITDPCYIIRDEKEYMDLESMPKWEDYHTVYYKDNEKKFLAESKLYDAANAAWRAKNPDDWQDVCNCGDNMEALGITTYLSRDTIYGDWSCHTYNTDTKEDLGSFCADAGLVAVFLLDEVLKYNPKFKYHIENPWTTTLIKDFDGDITIDVIQIEISEEERNGGEYFEDQEVRVIGKGNINFFTTQTGL